MKETVTITFDRYRTPDGEPTCAADFRTGDVCYFCQVRGVCGRIECCGATAKDLRRGEDGDGYLIPVNGCPLWREVK